MWGANTWASVRRRRVPGLPRGGRGGLSGTIAWGDTAGSSGPRGDLRGPDQGESGGVTCSPRRIRGHHVPGWARWPGPRAIDRHPKHRCTEVVAGFFYRELTLVCPTRFVQKEKRGEKRVQHQDFPGGHPSQYYSSLSALNYGVSSIVKPKACNPICKTFTKCCAL